jgi:hypothetical protein
MAHISAAPFIHSASSSSFPSFLISGINPMMKELTQELDQLGGGSARITELEFDCTIDDHINKDSYQILWPLGKSIGLRNAKLPKNHPVAESMRYFPVTSVGRYSSSNYSKTSIHYSQSRSAHVPLSSTPLICLSLCLCLSW